MSENSFSKTVGRVSLSMALGSITLFSACGGSSTTESSSTETSRTEQTSAVEAETTIGERTESPGWRPCSSEGATCAFVGTRQVRYGANGNYAYKTATRSIACNNSVFGDPAPGIAKACSISADPSPYLQDASQYTLTFRDEFDGTALNSGHWNDHIWYQQSASTRDYGVGNGLLKIWPQADSNGEFRPRILTTHQKFSQTYGYFEMEAKLPVGRGVWPAFWLLNSDSAPAEPEIDIMEAYPGGTPGYWADENQHPISFESSFYLEGYSKNKTDSTLSGNKKLDVGDLSTDFHTYAVKWEPNRLSYYFDGKLFYTTEVAIDKKMYMLLDIQYGADSGNVDSSTPLGPDNSFQINYVRAWQLK